jgi:hypothetical protein
MTVKYNIYDMFYQGISWLRTDISGSFSWPLNSRSVNLFYKVESYQDVKGHNSRVLVTFLLFCCIMDGVAAIILGIKRLIYSLLWDDLRSLNSFFEFCVTYCSET